MLIIWRLLDGKVGHEKQTQGLAAAIGQLTDTQIYSFRARGGIKAFWYWLTSNYPIEGSIPPPHIILSAGHGTHFDLLAARRRWGGKAILCMKPSLPMRLFDLCLIPHHDNPQNRNNIIVTKGVITPVRASKQHDPLKGLILVGGPSKHYIWDNQSIIDQVRSIIDSNHDVKWTLSTSRRTPNNFIPQMGNIGADVHTADKTPSGWIEQQMSTCGKVWVTPDSASMLYESITSGCKTGVFTLHPKTRSQIASGVNDLIRTGLITNDMSITPHSDNEFNEANRVAKEILVRLNV